MSEKNEFLPLRTLGVNLETPSVLRALIQAHRRLAELKGKAEQLPNSSMIIDTLILREAKESSEIENIITTHDEVYQYGLFKNDKNPAAKEVNQYAEAMAFGHKAVKDDKLLRLVMIEFLQEKLIGNNAGFRKQAGTVLRNDKTKEVIYEPPQDARQITSLLRELEIFINVDESPLDPLVKMSLIHLRFEKIHPFYDGNGRVGRIINLLYLVKEGLLETPVLYLSRYIIKTKAEYYELLSRGESSENLEAWVLYILRGVTETAIAALQLIQHIQTAMLTTEAQMRAETPKIFQMELLHLIYQYPYTKIQYVAETLNIKRVTASRKLDALVDANILDKRKVGRNNFYVNTTLMNLLSGD